MRPRRATGIETAVRCPVGRRFLASFPVTPALISTPPSPPRRGGPLARIAGWAQRHRWLALGLWVLVVVVTIAGSTVAGDDYRNDFSLPGTESQRVAELLEEHGPENAGTSVTVVLQHDDGLDAVGPRIDTVVDELATGPHVTGVEPPRAERGSLSADGTLGYATVALDVPAERMPVSDTRVLIDTALAAEGDGLQVALGGDPVVAAEEGGGGAAEGAGLLAALVILVLMFGSLLAAGLPLITALFAVGSTLGLLVLASHLVPVPDYTAPILLLVGLGVGIDYALLVFSRYRSELLQGAQRDTAARTALDTAGRSVLFAGCTVIIALLGLLVLGLGSLQGIALAVALVVLMTMLASVTLLPALMTVFGGRLERSIRRRASRSHRAPGSHWRAWAGRVQRSPWPPLVVAVAALAALALPALDMRLGFADAGNRSTDSTARQAYDLLAEGFGPGYNGPLVVVSDGGDAAALAEEVGSVEGIAAVTPPQPLPGSEVATVLAIPDSAPQDAATGRLLETLREDVLPGLAQQTGGRYLVGGSTAAAADFASAVGERMPWFIAVVVGLSTVLLVLVFRSLLIPIKAAVLNLLSIGASLGAVTLVFQDGWLGGRPGPIEAFVPVLIFAIVFGLSMDYEVFLLSRMHEEWRRTGDASHAVREGLAATGGVITAAGAIMIVVFGAFVLSPDRMLQQFGLGLAVAVLLDAVVIRCLIVPAVMQLFGPRAWHLPGSLDRVLPTVTLEPEPEPPAPPAVLTSPGPAGGVRHR
jgi:RND superfamily putative drug exporter